jgi:hypothetical protein
VSYRDNFQTDRLLERDRRSRKPRPEPKRSDLPCPRIASDIMPPVQSQVDGKMYDSKSAIRRSYKATGHEEIGNDPARLRPFVRPKTDRKAIKETVERAKAHASSAASATSTRASSDPGRSLAPSQTGQSHDDCCSRKRSRARRKSFRADRGRRRAAVAAFGDAAGGGAKVEPTHPRRRCRRGTRCALRLPRSKPANGEGLRAATGSEDRKDPGKGADLERGEGGKFAPKDAAAAKPADKDGSGRRLRLRRILRSSSRQRQPRRARGNPKRTVKHARRSASRTMPRRSGTRLRSRSRPRSTACTAR